MKKLMLGALALTLSAGLVGTAVPAQADPIPAVPATDTAPATGAAAYLAAQPEANNIIKTYYDFPVGLPYESYDDYGLTIDAAWALDAAGGQPAKLAAMTAALEANIANYAFGGGSKAKISAFLLSQGVSNGATDDLIEDIELNHIGDGTPVPLGRLFDDPEMDDFNSPLTQAFAVSALNNGGSDLADEALAFMLDQQCSAGFFRSSFAARAAVDQTCDGAAPAATGSVDTTGISLLMLQDQKSKPVVKAAIKKALDWLESVQATNGSFSGGNANATGLAGWVLGLGGRTASATEAAGWLRDHQLVNAGACTPFAAADNGGVALDDLGYANAQTGALDDLDTSVVVRATTQALPALLWADGGADDGEFTLSGPSGFVPAGSAQQFTLAGAPGDTVCVNGTKVVLGVTGAGTASVSAPAITGAFTVTAIDAGGETHSASLTALAKTTLAVKAKATLTKGKTLAIKISGLAPGETVTVTFGGKKATATAKANGKAKVKLVAAKAGKQKVKAVGLYKNRKGKATVTVAA